MGINQERSRDEEEEERRRHSLQQSKRDDTLGGCCVCNRQTDKDVKAEREKEQGNELKRRRGTR